MRTVAYAFVAMMGGAAITELHAQAVVRVGRADLQIPVRMTIGVRLTVSPSGPPVSVGSGPGYTELEIPLGVAANTSWTLSLSLPDGATQASVIAVRDASGTWVVPAGAQPVALVRRSEPTNPVDVRLRIRLAQGSAEGVVERLRLHLDPADGSVTP